MSKNTQPGGDRPNDSASGFSLNQRIKTHVTSSMQNRQNQLQQLLRHNHMVQMMRQNHLQPMARQNHMQQTVGQNPMEQMEGQNQMQQPAFMSPVARSVTQREVFDMDLCEALLSANIPLHKITNSKFRAFLEKYTGVNMPTERTLREEYVDDVYRTVVQVIRRGIGTHKIWVSIDETCDAHGRCVANVVVGNLMTGAPGHAYLLHSGLTDAGTDPTAVREMFDRAMEILWCGHICHDRVLLFLTDATPRMIKVGDLLTRDYAKMVHVTCAVHGAHRMIEDVRGRFNTVGDLMSDVSKIFRNSPANLLLFKTVAPGTALPPDPSTTRWGTGWLDAAMYYCDNYDAIVRFVNALDETESVNVHNAKLCLGHPRLRTCLLYIGTNFGTLSADIGHLENRNLKLAASLGAVDRIEKTFSELKGPFAAGIPEKLFKAFRENAGLTVLKKISKIITGEEEPIDTGLLARGLKVQDLLYFKYAPIASADVERSFPAYQSVLAGDSSGSFDNLRKRIVIQCNTKA